MSKQFNSMDLNTISITIEYKGFPVKVESGKIYLPSFGTTSQNQKPHTSWQEVRKVDLRPEFVKMLTEKGLI